MDLDLEQKERLSAAVRRFALPAYEEIPDVGLFLDQTTKYVQKNLEPIRSFTVTASMVSNYVKKGLLENPVRKLYGRDQIAHLFFIVIAKTVLTMEEIQMLLQLQKLTRPTNQAYAYFRQELKRTLENVFELRPLPNALGHSDSHEKNILHNTILAVSHKIYLDQCLELLQEQKEHKN